MRIITLGCGYIGSVLAVELANALPEAQITISDTNLSKVQEIHGRIGKDNVFHLQLDLSNREELVRALKGFDLVIGLAPGRLGYTTVKATIETGLDMVDLSYMPEDPLALNEEALEAGITVIPDCGFAPGLSNILVGRAASLLDEVYETKILVGGIPEKPIPPLEYKVTWCVEDLIEEYVRKARIVKDGQVIEVEALDGLEEVSFPGIGRLEAFYTDGVRTLHHTLRGARNIWEKTMRYPGHAEKVRLLRDLGFFGEKPIEVDGVTVSPRQLTTRVLEHSLSVPEVRDLVIMRIEISGVVDGVESKYIYTLLDRCDAERGISAMGRTTAYTASAVVKLLARKDLEKGVVPPERLGMHDDLFKEIMAELRMKGIVIDEDQMG